MGLFNRASAEFAPGRVLAAVADEPEAARPQDEIPSVKRKRFKRALRDPEIQATIARAKAKRSKNSA
jgi:hypothetical protein